MIRSFLYLGSGRDASPRSAGPNLVVSNSSSGDSLFIEPKSRRSGVLLGKADRWGDLRDNERRREGAMR